MEDPTKRRRVRGLPLKGIRVEVVGGPQEGLPAFTSTEPISIGTSPGNDIVLTDPLVSRYHLEVSRDRERIAVVDLGSTNGTQVGPVSFTSSRVHVPATSLVTIGETTLKLSDGGVVMVDHADVEGMDALKGRAPAMRRLMATIARIAPQEVGVLAIGESGTGKELIARAIHENSARAGGPFVTLDCAAIPPTLFASELLGHERGAFTGAERRHRGAAERAHGGTLFLDEIGELPPEAQSALLGCIERRRITRLGSQEELPVDIRIVAATHRDLRAAVNEGTFRLDLFYRLAVVRLAIPPLRERRDDIPLLATHFLRESGFDGPLEEVFTEESMLQLKTYGWPGNVRELRNVVASTLAVGESPSWLLDEQAIDNGDVIDRVLTMSYREGRGQLLREFERRYLAALLERSEGNVRRAARVAKMDRSYLIELLKRHELR